MTVVRLGGFWLRGDNGWGPREGARLFSKSEAARFMKQFRTYYPNAVEEGDDEHGEVQTRGAAIDPSPVRDDRAEVLQRGD